MYFKTTTFWQPRELQVFRTSLLSPAQKQQIAERLGASIKAAKSVGAEYSKSFENTIKRRR